MAEKSLWAYLRKGMKGKWAHATRHEDLLGVGIADASFYHHGNSWMELKEVQKLPARETTGISLGQWHENGGAQRHFLIKRKGWLMIRVNRPKRFYLLFSHHSLPPWRKDARWTWREFKDNAYYIWPNRIYFDTLESILGKSE